MRSLRNIMITCFVSTLLCSCATQQAYEKRMQVYIGKPIDAVMESGNIPSREYTMPSGNKIYCFSSSSFMTLPIMSTPTQSVSTVSGKNIYTTSYGGTVYGGQTINLWCNTCFVTDSNRIIKKYNLQGNNCVAQSS